MLLTIFVIYLKKSKQGGLYPPLLLACMLCAMVLFPASKDYKLALVGGVFILYVLYLENQLVLAGRTKRIAIQILFGIIAMSYSAILFLSRIARWF